MPHGGTDDSVRTMRNGTSSPAAPRKTSLVALAVLGALVMAAAPAAAQSGDLRILGEAQGALSGDLHTPDVPQPRLDGALDVEGHIDAQLDAPRPETPRAPETRGYLHAFAELGASAALTMKGTAEAIVDGVSGLMDDLKAFVVGTSAGAEARATAEAGAAQDMANETRTDVERTRVKAEARLEAGVPSVELPRTPSVGVDGQVTAIVRGFL